jgi:hypothetical protein
VTTTRSADLALTSAAFRSPDGKRKTPVPGVFSSGAPRFELGTSSLPDLFGNQAGRGPKWREVASLQALRVFRTGTTCIAS